MTHEDLSKHVGCGRYQIFRIANGKVKSPKLAMRIEQFTKGEVTITEIMFPDQAKETSEESSPNFGNALNEYDVKLNIKSVEMGKPMTYHES